MSTPGSNEERIKKLEKKKKILKIAVLTVIGAFAALVALSFILPAIESRLRDQRKSELEDRARRSIIFAPSNWDLDIFQEEGYLILGRDVWVNEGVISTVITDVNYIDYAPEVRFMYDIVNFIINGNYAEYNKIFTDEFIRAHEDGESGLWSEEFTMQQLFEIEISYVKSGLLEYGGMFYDMQLSYRIRNNNGTFRRDLEANDEGSLPIIYRLVSHGSGFKVSDKLTRLQYHSGLY
jgi:hypothetical protein